MNTLIQFPEPVLFNPLKHHMGFMRGWSNNINDRDTSSLRFYGFFLYFGKKFNILTDNNYF